jgi:hypothetical protein
MPTFVWNSKPYTFGAAREASPEVSEAIQPGFPKRLLVTGSYRRATGEHIRIFVKLGGSGELKVLDTSTTPKVDLLDQEIDLLTSGSNLLPASDLNWALSFRVEFDAAQRDPNPESPNSPFAPHSNVTLYLYRDLLTQNIVVRSDPMETDTTRSNIPVTSAQQRYVPLKHVQTVFYFSNQPSKVRAATVVSNSVGRITASLPAGKYDIEMYGGGIIESDWPRGYPVGAANNLTPWQGSSTTSVTQAAEFNVLRSQFATLFWPGYVVMEDFTDERAQFRSESLAAPETHALQLYGRALAGSSFVEFIGIAVDPSPE